MICIELAGDVSAGTRSGKCLRLHLCCLLLQMPWRSCQRNASTHADRASDGIRASYLNRFMSSSYEALYSNMVSLKVARLKRHNKVRWPGLIHVCSI